MMAKDKEHPCVTLVRMIATNLHRYHLRGETHDSACPAVEPAPPAYDPEGINAAIRKQLREQGHGQG